jgi:enoyl-[acyl-carrier-protein] reductase (NADH)
MTELNQTALESERGKEFIAAFPRRRVVSMEALDPMMLYFASDVSAQTTGAVIDVDDGQSL